MKRKGCGMPGEASFLATCGCEGGSTWTQQCKPESCVVVVAAVVVGHLDVVEVMEINKSRLFRYNLR